MEGSADSIVEALHRAYSVAVEDDVVTASVHAISIGMNQLVQIIQQNAVAAENLAVFLGVYEAEKAQDGENADE